MRKSGTKAFGCGCLTGGVLAYLALAALLAGTYFFYRDGVVDSMAGRMKAPPITTNVTARYDWHVIDANGDRVSLEQARGKALFLNFWHPDCLACLAELDAVDRLYTATENPNIAFFTIIQGSELDPGAIREQHALEAPVYRATGEIPEPFGETTIPRTYVVAPDGSVALKHFGAARWDDPSAVALLEFLAKSAEARETQDDARAADG
jgi:thiol-disulfide isomerase/thioredoxin